MSDEKLTFTLTGNFQYDLGILGLKKVLGFFGFEYKNNDYSISINKSDWLKIGRCAYFYCYKFNGLEQIKKKFKIKNTINENNFNEKIKQVKNFYCFEDNIKNLKEVFNIDDNKITEFASYPALSVFNVSHLNVFNPILLKLAKKNKQNDFFYNLFIKRFKDSPSSQSLSIKTCDFCHSYEGEPLNRMNFLFASSAMNQGWFEKQNIHICNYCSALNLFSTFGTIVSKSGERFLIYSSNLEDLENDNKVLANSFEELVSKYIEEIGVETNAKDKLFIKMVFSGENPDVDFLPFSAEVIKFFIENKELINKLKENNFIGIAKNPIVSAYRDTIKSIINGEDLFSKIDFITNCIIKQNSGNKNFNGFDNKAIKECLYIIDISLKFKGMKGGFMNLDNGSFDEFIKFGDDIRKRLYAGKSLDAAKNKAISFASNIRDAVNESKEKFMETLLQLSIYSQLTIPLSLIRQINDPNFNYKEAGLAIALTLMSKKED